MNHQQRPPTLARLLRRLLLVAACGASGLIPSHLAAQSVACTPGEPHPDAPPEIRQFDFLLGRWDIKARGWTEAGEWSEGFQPAYWEGEYVLDGFAIADYWYDAPPGGEEPVPGRGVNVRMYDPEAGFWRMTWQHTNLSGVRLLEAELVDGNVVMWQLQDDGSRFPGRRVTFYVTGPDSWHRIDELSDDGGETWRNQLKLEATRRECR